MRTGVFVACVPPRHSWCIANTGVQMKTPLSNFLNEIVARLGPQLNELGVEAKASRTQGGYRVSFKGRDGYVPLNIMIVGRVLLPQSTLKLEDCTVFFERWAAVGVGANGWTFYEYMNNASFKFSGRVDDDFAQLSAMITKLGIVRDPGPENKVTANENIALAYEHLAERLALYGDFDINYSSVGRVETLEFVDPADRVWRFDFKAGQVRVSIEGKKVASFDPTDRFGMQDLISARIQPTSMISSKF